MACVPPDTPHVPSGQDSMRSLPRQAHLLAHRPQFPCRTVSWLRWGQAFRLGRGHCGRNAEERWLSLQETDVGLQAVVQPSSYVVTRRASSAHHLMMAPPAAQVTSPAASAGLLTMHMSFGKPAVLTLGIDTVAQISHCS